MLDADSQRFLDYREWLTRADATYEAVTFCCFHRLRDRKLAERVGIRVVAGLVARPTIFAFSGLPFSGRVGNLAEQWIAAAKEGKLGEGGDWRSLYDELARAPQTHQEIFVLACVWGNDDAQIAAALGCDAETARARRSIVLEFYEKLARNAVPLESAFARVTHLDGGHG